MNTLDLELSITSKARMAWRDVSSPTVIVVPGGGFLQRSMIERLPVVEALHQQGINTVLFDYSTPKTHYPQPFKELDKIVEWCYEEQGDQISVFLLGFSAGANIVENYLHYGNQGEIIKGVGLGYPLLDLEAFYQEVGEYSVPMLASALENYECQNERMKYSAFYRVTLASVPRLIWHAQDDLLIAIQHSIRMVERLKDQGSEVKFIEAKTGGHGFGIGTSIESSIWFLEFVEFVKSIAEKDSLKDILG